VQRPIGAFLDRGVFDLLTISAERDHAGIKIGTDGWNRRDGCDRSGKDDPEPEPEPEPEHGPTVFLESVCGFGHWIRDRTPPTSASAGALATLASV
jgi:hypothetical protein